MELNNEVQEQQINEVTLQVYHRQFKVPEEVYLQSVAEFTDPWDERAYQKFVQKYLGANDDPGIVGMVRVKKEPPYLYFDAAVRYPRENL